MKKDRNELFSDHIKLLKNDVIPSLFIYYFFSQARKDGSKPLFHIIIHILFKSDRIITSRDKWEPSRYFTIG